VHPVGGEDGDVQNFSDLVEAYHTLKDPTTRAAYDIEYQQQKRQIEDLASDAATADNDTAERYKLLSLFYAKRRRDKKNPGVAPTSIEKLMGCPPEVVDFHLWYFREKGWIMREESGLLSITAFGVDRIDEMNIAYATAAMPRVNSPIDRLETDSVGA
jgi:hypothetical protein